VLSSGKEVVQRTGLVSPLKVRTRGQYTLRQHELDVGLGALAVSKEAAEQQHAADGAARRR